MRVDPLMTPFEGLFLSWGWGGGGGVVEGAYKFVDNKNYSGVIT